MKLSRYTCIFPAMVAGILCILMAAPVAAHPGSLWGIDLTSVLTMRDQTRMITHQHQRETSDSELVEDYSQDLDQVRTVVIDPGHGGANIGAVGVAGIPEKRLTLELAHQLREELQERYPRLRVVMTRYWDTTVELDERARIANLASADLFISLHYNAATHHRAVGFETFFLGAEEATEGADEITPTIEGNVPTSYADDSLRLIEHDLLRAHRHELSAELAESIQSHFVRHVDSVDRGVKQGNFSVLRNAAMPAVVVEAGFMTHSEEGIEILTDEHQSRVTTSLMEAIEEFDDILADQLDDHNIQESKPPEDEEPEDSEDSPIADGISLR